MKPLKTKEIFEIGPRGHIYAGPERRRNPRCKKNYLVEIALSDGAVLTRVEDISISGILLVEDISTDDRTFEVTVIRNHQRTLTLTCSLVRAHGSSSARLRIVGLLQEGLLRSLLREFSTN